MLWRIIFSLIVVLFVSLPVLASAAYLGTVELQLGEPQKESIAKLVAAGYIVNNIAAKDTLTDYVIIDTKTDKPVGGITIKQGKLFTVTRDWGTYKDMEQGMNVISAIRSAISTQGKSTLAMIEEYDYHSPDVKRTGIRITFPGTPTKEINISKFETQEGGFIFIEEITR